MAELKVQLFLNVKRGDKEYSFVCENGSDLGESYSAYCEIGKWFVERITEAEKSKEPKEEVKEKKEAKK